MSQETGYKSAYEKEGDGYNSPDDDDDLEEPADPDKSDDKKSEPVPKT